MIAAAPVATTSSPQTPTPPGTEAHESTPDADFLAALMAMISPTPAATSAGVTPAVAASDEGDKLKADDADEAAAAMAGICPVEQILPILPVDPPAAKAAVSAQAATQSDADAECASISLSESLQRSRMVRTAGTPDIAVAREGIVSTSDLSAGSDAPSATSVPADPAAILAAVNADTRAPLPGAANPAQQTSQIQVATPASSAPVPTAQDLQPAPRLHEQVGSARWANELGTRISLMAARGQQNGSLTLSPDHLGPLEVQINVSQDTASVWFGAQHADTRAALQEAMPRLRELFAASGLSLGHTSVSQQTPRQEANPFAAPSGGTGIDADMTVTELRAPQSLRIALGLIDTYA
jgi:flagellar hook-length control protein FliK